MNNLAYYFMDIGRIQNYLRNSNDSFGDIHIGQRLDAVVNQVGQQGGCSLFLDGDIQGLVDAQHCPGSTSTYYF